MADEDSVGQAVRNLGRSLSALIPSNRPYLKYAFEVVLTGGIGLSVGLFPNRIVAAGDSAAAILANFVTSNVFIVSLLGLVLYNQSKMQQSSEERQPTAKTDGGTTSGDPVAFLVGAIIGLLLGSQYLDGAALAMMIIGSGFVFYEYERAKG